jgi:hypothetical protein
MTAGGWRERHVAHARGSLPTGGSESVPVEVGIEARHVAAIDKGSTVH